MPLTGEGTQLLGEQGAQRAKYWLEATCRAEVYWSNPLVCVEKLQYRKLGATEGSASSGDYFSFDLGGRVTGGEEDGRVFLAESKKYSSPRDQGGQYRRFLAQCYAVETNHSNLFDYFFWITWSPFLVESWHELLTSSFVKSAIEESDDNRYIALGSDDIDEVRCSAIATKVLIVVISDGQEILLSLRGGELGHVRKALIDIRRPS